MDKVVYIHYGSDTYYDPDPVINRDYSFTKPIGGLWASREGDNCGWKNWCEREEFHLSRLNTNFKFTLKDDARILRIDHEDQLDNLPKLKNYNKDNEYDECCLDFEKLKQNYDAIEVDITVDYRIYWRLYAWDCNSILIMNPEIIELYEYE
jgi:hypothetical protein